MVKIYTLSACPYCVSAKALLARKRIAFEEINVDSDPAVRQRVKDLTGITSLPQIYIGEHHVGGRDDLFALDREGKLDELLSETAKA